MILAITLHHPQSVDLLPKRMFDTLLAQQVGISCGTTKVAGVQYSESNDFFPTYASWNSALFETSVILTAWEHANELIGDNDVAILHTDIEPHFKADETWQKVGGWLRENEQRAVGMTAPMTYQGIWDDWLIPEQVPFVPKYDPMRIHLFDNNIGVWDFIDRYDPDIFQWAMDTQPRLIYAHQFACTRQTFDKLGDRLMRMVRKLRFGDVGLWTPHMFERLIGLYLAHIGGPPVLSTAFWHHSSSGVNGPGEQSLYGPRSLRYYRVASRYGRSVI